jgi:hypothetical protein
MSDFATSAQKSILIADYSFTSVPLTSFGAFSCFLSAWLLSALGSTLPGCIKEIHHSRFFLLQEAFVVDVRSHRVAGWRQQSTFP